MNNKIIALAAVAAFTVPMAAQAGAKVGGHLQVEIANIDNNGTSYTNTADNKRGRLWFTGSEDLGGGLKANYRFEWQVDTTTGNVNNGARETRVGLSGSWGEFQMGRLKTAYKYTAGVNYDPYTATLLESRGNGGALKKDNGMSAFSGQNSFWSNALAYKAKFGSTKLWVNYQFVDTSSSQVEDDNIAIGVSVGVAKGLKVDVAYVEENKVSATNGGTRAKIGVQWKGGPHKVFVKYESQSSDLASSDVSTIFAGYNFKMGKNVITAQYGAKSNDVANSDVTYTMVAFAHNFSKKTKAWAGIMSSDSDNNAKDKDVVSVGLRIKF